MATINLIHNTGIQFVDLTSNLGEGSIALKSNLDYYEIVHEDHSSELLFVTMDDKGRYVDLLSGDAIVDPKTREPVRLVDSVSARRAIECFEGQWIPLPFLRQKMVSGKPEFENGPLAWVRGCFQPLRRRGPGDATHSLVLAFDTMVMPAPGATYTTPLQQDLNQAVFALASEPNHVMGFLSEDWIQLWIQICFDARRARLGDIGSDGHQFHHLAYFTALLRVLASSTTIPTIRVTGEMRKGGHVDLERENPIEVDLVLDIGNSRSCGLLMQSYPNEIAEFNTNSSRLVIRDLSQPDQIYDEPFEMHVEFIKPNFGPDEAISISGRPNAFSWPSIVRIGSEAVRRSIVNGSDLYETGMSSPKRYLWDERRRDEGWRFNETKGVPKPALSAFTNFFSADGKLLDKDPSRTLAIHSRFSRASVMTFVFAELILHALVQINSVKFRQHHGWETRRRVLKRVTVTCPTAMLEREKVALRQHAENAVKALDGFFGNEPNGSLGIRIIPSSEDLGRPIDRRQDWGYDEATCVQLAYVYGEVASRFGGDVKTFFGAFGRPRRVSAGQGDREETTLRIATIDIGGGTTDVMVCNYHYDDRAATPTVTPHPEFWEGFNLAGDDIMKRVIERCVLPAIAAKAAEAGCRDTPVMLNSLFSGNFGAQSANERNLRRLFANQIAVPVALAMLRHAVERAPVEDRTYRSFFENHPSPQRSVEAYVENKVVAMGGAGFRLADMSLRLDYREVELAVRQVMQRRIGELCGILAQYDCDLLLLSGRPALMPVVREMIVSFLPTPPDRIINLGRYRSGTWYPFADARGMIRDPKTCVAVGAAVALMGGTLGRLGGFRLDDAQLRSGIFSTAEHIGVFNPSTTTLDRVAAGDGADGQVEIVFSGEMLVGMRQMPSDDWVSTPMFKMRFESAERAEQLKNKLPLTVTLRRNPTHLHLREDIKIVSVRDRNNSTVEAGALELIPQSLVSEAGYWLDTGSFLVTLY